MMERYEIVKELGSGNFGVAKLVCDKNTKELFAVKFIERGQKVSPFINLNLMSLIHLRYFSCIFICFDVLRLFVDR